MSTELVPQLSEIEAKRYEKLKAKVHRWMEDRFAVGDALGEILNRRLYTLEYSTFEAFCETEYGIKKSRAYQLIEAAEVKAGLQGSTMVDKVTNERQARALAAVPEEDRAKVVEEASKTGKVTSKTITEAATRTAEPKTEKPIKTIHLDKTGYPIPDSILEDWQRAEGYSEVLQDISRIKCQLEDGLTEGDFVLFAELTNNTVANIKNVYADLSTVLPYAVCSTCQGHQRQKCTLCRGRGFLSKFRYKTCVPAEVKAIRERSASK